MKFCSEYGTTWKPIEKMCERCGNQLYREVYNEDGKELKNHTCESYGCTWANYHDKELIKIKLK